jgi:hypothetical protein
MTVKFTYQSGNRVETAEINLPPTASPDFPSCGIFAFAKSGSVLVNSVVRDLMGEVGIPVVDWATIWYERGIDTAAFQGDLVEAFPSHGYCFAGFREIPRSFLAAPSLQRLRKIMVVRDPRDMLVSRYYSTKYSHGFSARGTAQYSQLMHQLIEDGKMDIDEYCLYYSWIVNADYFIHKFIIEDKQTLVLRYEDFLYEKEMLGCSLCDWLSIRVSQQRISTIVAAYSRLPETENPNLHIRQAHPGDHLRKLKPETISALNGVLGAFIRKFGYAIASEAA